MMYGIAIAVFICISVSNFLTQAYMEKKWSVAFERSLFQGVAIVFVIVAQAFITTRMPI